MSRSRLLLLACAVVVLAAGALPATGASARTTARADLPTYTWSSTPSPVVLLLQRRRTLRPQTYCWKSPPATPGGGGEVGYGFVCADAFTQTPRSRLAKVARTAPIRFWFGRPGWRWNATIRSFGQPKRPGCTVHRRPERLAARRFELQAPKHHGTYRVSMSGRGPEGDVLVEFSWRYGARPGRCT